MVNDREVRSGNSATSTKQLGKLAALIDASAHPGPMTWAEIESMPGGQTISVLAVDNRQLVMIGIVSALKGEPGINLVAKVSSGTESLAAIEKFRPDVALLKLRMPGKSAFEIIEALHAIGSPTRPIIIAGGMTHDEFMRAMELRVKGVFFLGMPASLLSRCVRVVHANGEFIKTDIWRRSIEVLNQRPGTTPPALPGVLTARERAIAELAMNGLGNKQVARKLDISEGTVKVHLHRIYGKLKITGRFGLIKLASEKAALRLMGATLAIGLLEVLGDLSPVLLPIVAS